MLFCIIYLVEIIFIFMSVTILIFNQHTKFKFLLRMLNNIVFPLCFEREIITANLPNLEATSNWLLNSLHTPFNFNIQSEGGG